MKKTVHLDIADWKETEETAKRMIRSARLQLMNAEIMYSKALKEIRKIERKNGTNEPKETKT